MEKKRIEMPKIKLQKDVGFVNELHNALQTNNELTNWDLFSLLYSYKKHTHIKQCDNLLTINMLPHVQFLEHQIKTAQTVISEMNGRAILADEVGLGKT